MFRRDNIVYVDGLPYGEIELCVICETEGMGQIDKGFCCTDCMDEACICECGRVTKAIDYYNCPDCDPSTDFEKYKWNGEKWVLELFLSMCECSRMAYMPCGEQYVCNVCWDEILSLI
jgi:hypothetical protein